MSALHLRKVNPTESKAGKEHDGTLPERAFLNPAEATGDCVRTVGGRPGLANFRLGLFNGYLVRSVGHTKWTEVQPMLRPCQPARLEQAIIKRSGGIRRHQAVHGQQKSERDRQ